MNRFFFTTLMMLGFLHANAYEYPYLVFQNSEGSTKILSVESLSITISDGKLVATNVDGTQTFTLSELSKMFFSKANDQTAINENVTTNDEEVEVFTTGGMTMGKFASLSLAKASLKPGIYVIKNSQKTYKIAVK